MNLSPTWEFVSDRVMGGVSDGKVEQNDSVARLTGQVSLDNNGGFIQMAFDLSPDGDGVDLTGWDGVRMDVQGNNQTYEMRLRTLQLERPWQSFKAAFMAAQNWRTVTLPFDCFEPHRTQMLFNPAAVRRIGVLGIGREFAADVSVARLRLFKYD